MPIKKEFIHQSKSTCTEFISVLLPTRKDAEISSTQENEQLIYADHYSRYRRKPTYRQTGSA